MPRRITTFQWLSKSRLDAIVDGIFAFSMTLLVASLIFPSAITVTGSGADLYRLIPSLILNLVYYAIAFFILSTFWVLTHLHSYFIRKIDLTSVRLVMIAMFFVALMPVSTAIAAVNSGTPVAEVFLEANICAIGTFYLLHWYYATTRGRLLDTALPEAAYCISVRRGVVTPLVSVAAIILALTGVPFSILLYVTVPLFEWCAEYSCGFTHATG